MLLPASAAHAGHWEFTCTGDGNNTINYAYPGMFPKITNWVAPTAPQVGSFSLGGFGDGSDYANSSITTINVTVTATWKADGGEDDTVPPSVWLCESASADWSYGQSGSADDGFGDAPVPRSVSPGGAISFTATSNPTPPYIPAPPPHWKSYPVSGGSVTLPKRTLTAEADYPDMYGDYGGNCYANVDSYTVTVHPQPYGWYNYGWNDPQGMHHDGPNIAGGVMTYEWGWGSTSGKIADLQGISIYETLDYSGNPGTISADGKTFYPQSPPIQNGYSVPNGIAGTPFNGQQLYARDVHSPFPVSSSATIQFTVPQKYKFDDSATQETGTLLYDCGNIVEGNFANPNRWEIDELGSVANTYYY